MSSKSLKPGDSGNQGGHSVRAVSAVGCDGEAEFSSTVTASLTWLAARPKMSATCRIPIHPLATRHPGPSLRTWTVAMEVQRRQPSGSRTRPLPE